MQTKNKLTFLKLDELFVVGAMSGGIKSYEDLETIVEIVCRFDYNVPLQISYVNEFKSDFDFIKKIKGYKYIETKNTFNFNYEHRDHNIEFIEKTEFEEELNLIGYIKFGRFCVLIFEKEIIFFKQKHHFEEFRKTNPS